MIKNISALLLFILMFGFASCDQTESNNQEIIEVLHTDSLHLIPFPNSLTTGQGYFNFNQFVVIENSDDLKSESEYINNLLSNKYNEPLKETNNTGNSSKVTLKVVANEEKPESYTLKITTEKITITGGSPAGVMRGIQTLRQLFVPAFHTSEKRSNWQVPALTIEDAPRFQHRGLLLDVCRHFFDKEVVLKYIDALAYYKMNVLHFHLTEDQGWRIPIEKYPLLNEISAWRTDTNGNQYGGYYSKEDLEEIVAYASERHITVIPEVELPGHAQAALAAYPQFSCNGGPIEVINDWGVFKEIYCAGNDSTFTFIEDVLTEVMAIFPSEYIHIGGDEAPKFRWEHCEKCQKRMKDEGLHDEHELQSYFISRIERFLNEHNRKLIGWDEILEGGLSENAAVQSWRGMEGGTEAASTQHEVIMSPTSHCYLDYGLSSIDLEKIYNFNPIPLELDSANHAYIIGGEANMWTEHVPDEKNLDSKVFPRTIGLAEVLWSYPENPDFEDFYARLQNHYPTLKAFGIDYGLETIGATLLEDFEGDSIQIILKKNLDNLNLSYYWDVDSSNKEQYTTPITLKKSGVINVQAFKGEIPYGDPIKQYYAYHKGLNTDVSYGTNYNKWYVGNAKKHLVDGKNGSLDFRDGNWQGFWGENIDVTMDLGKIITINEVFANFYQYSNSWIFLPKKVEIQLSEDGENWGQSIVKTYEDIDLSNTQSISRFNLSAQSNARYIRFKATNIGKVPEGHEAAGQDTWLFIDEIIIR